tara:strand:- start:3578 stop:4243 length:666 start_codon:yes stop_codon:yes gene_type:complete
MGWKKIYMTHKKNEIPERVFRRWQEKNPGYKIEFSDDESCMKFIKKHYGKGYAHLFKNIKYGPNKADLWRLCKLYKNGGIYADIDLIPYVSISEMIGESNFCTCLGIDKKSIFQAFISVEKKNPIIFECLESLYKNREKYKWNGNEPTVDMYNILKKIVGSDIEGNREYLLEKYNKKKMRILEEFTDNRWEDSYVRYNSNILLKSRDLSYLKSKKEGVRWL